MTSICQNLFLGNLNVLMLRDVGIINESAWFETFAHLSSLQTLCVRGQPIYGLLGALSRVSRSTTEYRSGILLPSLQKLVIEDADFHLLTVGELLTCIAFRESLHIPIHELHVIRCVHFNEATVKILEDSIALVTWDGFTGCWSSEEDSESSSNTSEEILSDYGTEYETLEEFDCQSV